VIPPGLRPHSQSGLEVSRSKPQFSLHHLSFWPLLLAVRNWPGRFFLPVCRISRIHVSRQLLNPGAMTMISPPSPPTSHQQKAWDMPRVGATCMSLLDSATDSQTRAASWLSSTGRLVHGSMLSQWPPLVSSWTMRQSALQWDSVGLPVYRPHQCVHCGSPVDELGTHGLSLPIQ